jgi:NTP pyrophosphatase (non-canonical NTP hydrolase)
MSDFKMGSFPKLNGLNTISMESTALKLMEEAGELAQAISKFRGLNGEKDIMTESDVADKIASELLDCMQVCASMSYIIEDVYNINMNDKFKQHVDKLANKGYYIPIEKEFPTD